MKKGLIVLFQVFYSFLCLTSEKSPKEKPFSEGFRFGYEDEIPSSRRESEEEDISAISP